MSSHDHAHDGVSHSHPGGDHGHTHEVLDGPGSYLGRDMPTFEGRDWNERAFTIGIGGYVKFAHSNAGKTQNASDKYACVDPLAPARLP